MPETCQSREGGKPMSVAKLSAGKRNALGAVRENETVVSYFGLAFRVATPLQLPDCHPPSKP